MNNFILDKIFVKHSGSQSFQKLFTIIYFTNKKAFTYFTTHVLLIKLHYFKNLLFFFVKINQKLLSLRLCEHALVQDTGDF